MSELSETSPEICKTLQTEKPVRRAEGLSGNPNKPKSLECLHAWARPLIILEVCFFYDCCRITKFAVFCSFGSWSWSIALLGQFIIVWREVRDHLCRVHPGWLEYERLASRAHTILHARKGQNESMNAPTEFSDVPELWVLVLEMSVEANKW